MTLSSISLAADTRQTVQCFFTSMMLSLSYISTALLWLLARYILTDANKYNDMSKTFAIVNQTYTLINYRCRVLSPHTQADLSVLGVSVQGVR